MQRILVTGNRGFFGSRFQRHYSSEYEILGIDKDDVDIVDRDALVEVVTGFRPDIIVHGAAITATGFSDQYPELTHQINVDGAVNVGEAAKAVKAKLLFFSTEQVFNGNQEPGPYSESDKPVPNTMYGKTKLEAEELLRQMVEELWIVRFTWMFGLPERDLVVNPNVLWEAISIALSGTPHKIPVNEYRGLTWVYHMLERILKVLELPSDLYHIGSENDLGRYQVLQHVFNEIGIGDRAEELLIPDREKYGSHSRDIRLDTAKLTSFGVSFPSSKQAISDCLESFSMRGIVV